MCVARLRAHCVSLARSLARVRVGGSCVRVRAARLISRANLRACIQWVSAVNASNHPPAMATRGYHYRRAGRYSFHLQLWRVRVQRPWEFAGSTARDSARVWSIYVANRCNVTLPDYRRWRLRECRGINTAARNRRRAGKFSRSWFFVILLLLLINEIFY